VNAHSNLVVRVVKKVFLCLYLLVLVFQRKKVTKEVAYMKVKSHLVDLGLHYFDLELVGMAKALVLLLVI